jgi:mono/diheme cytochrome c family protein
MDCKAYLYESLTAPSAFVVPGFDPIMQDMRRQLPEDQIWAVIAYLQSLGGEVTVTGADLQRNAAAAPSNTPTGATVTATTDPRALYTEKGCVGCHQLDGKGGAIGPSFDHIGKGVTADYIRRSILTPNADTAKGYEKFAGTMPAVFGQQLSAAQLEALVTFLASRK